MGSRTGSDELKIARAEASTHFNGEVKRQKKEPKQTE